MSKNILTSHGKKQLEEQLRRLNSIELSKALNNLTEARERGGVNENSEYFVAKEEYEKLQIRIHNIREKLSDSIVVSTTDVNTDVVSILSSVRILNKKTNQESVFTIVPENEIDIKSGKISSNSPIATGLLNKKVGDICEISVPSGLICFEILEIFVK